MIQYPHCDQNILHAPSKCKYCDLSPDLQQWRLDNGVNFTGEHIPGLSPCPSELRRSLKDIERWPGNRPVPEYGRPRNPVTTDCKGMCVYSQVLDHYRPEFDRFPSLTPDWIQQPVTVDTVAKPLDLFGLSSTIAELRALIAEFREALTAAKTVDRLTKQPDCEDPAKKALEDRVAELERMVKGFDWTFDGCKDCEAQKNNQDHKDHRPKRRGRK